MNTYLNLPHYKRCNIFRNSKRVHTIRSEYRIVIIDVQNVDHYYTYWALKADFTYLPSILDKLLLEILLSVKSLSAEIKDFNLD